MLEPQYIALVKPVQPLNAEPPMVVRVFLQRKITFLIYLLPENMLEGTALTPSPKVTVTPLVSVPMPAKTS